MVVPETANCARAAQSMNWNCSSVGIAPLTAYVSEAGWCVLTAAAIAVAVGAAVVTEAFIVAVRSPAVGALVRLVTVVTVARVPAGARRLGTAASRFATRVAPMAVRPAPAGPIRA